MQRCRTMPFCDLHENVMPRRTKHIALHHRLHIYTHAPSQASPQPANRWIAPVNQQFGKQAFDQAEKLFKDARVPENVQAIAQQGVAASKEFYAKTAAAAQDGAKVMTEIADTAWGSTKLLNEKIVQNLTANAEAAFTAAQAMATAKSLPEIAKLQGEFMQKSDCAGKRADQGILRSVGARHAAPVREGASRNRQVVQVHVLNACRSRQESETAAGSRRGLLIVLLSHRTHGVMPP